MDISGVVRAARLHRFVFRNISSLIEFFNDANNPDRGAVTGIFAASYFIGVSGFLCAVLRLLSGQDAPDAGEVVLPEGWHSAILTPDPYVITWTSVLRNVAMAAGVGHNPEERLELSKEFVRIVGLEDFSDLTPAELSTGMKQRLGLARVLASQAQLLLMDEPFASLDFITRGELQAELLRIQKRMPRTIVLVTHQLEEAVLLGEKILVMHPDSTLKTYDLTGLPYPRDPDSPALRALEADITAECRRG